MADFESVVAASTEVNLRAAALSEAQAALTSSKEVLRDTLTGWCESADAYGQLCDPVFARQVFKAVWVLEDRFVDVFARVLGGPLVKESWRNWMRVPLSAQQHRWDLIGVPHITVGVMPNLSDETIEAGWARLAPVVDATRAVADEWAGTDPKTGASPDYAFPLLVQARGFHNIRVTIGRDGDVWVDEVYDEYWPEDSSEVEAFTSVPAALTFVRDQYPMVPADMLNRRWD